MAYDPLAVANYFLEHAWENGDQLSNMKLQKLVYYAHGWHLALTEQPLIDRRIEAWPWGPVVPAIYHEFKFYGNEPILGLAPDALEDADDDGEIPPCVIPEDSEGKPYAIRLLNRIYEVYGGYTPSQLSNMTHAEGTPWEQISKQYGGQIPKRTVIEDEAIREYFKTHLNIPKA